MINDIKIIGKPVAVDNNKNDILPNDVVQSRSHFFGVRFDNLNKVTALSLIKKFLKEKNRQNARKIFFTNVHTIYLARKNPVFAQVINRADLVLPDGSGLKIAGQIFSKPVKENLNGTDLTPSILEIAKELERSVYLLGATREVVKECVHKLDMLYPGLKIAGFHSGFFDEAEEKKLVEEIVNISPDLLFIAMGSPGQELFAEKIAGQLKNTVCFAVGGFFDFISGYKKRAPQIFRNSGLEWIFRFFQDPKTKWDRIAIEIPAFLLSVITARYFTNSIFSSTERRPFLI